jgi:alpha-beta hydrolase superfamily lysophospholipase
MSLHERQVTVRAPDGALIYNTIGVPSKKTDSIVLLVHGLASTEVWPTMLLGGWYFRQRGFAYCRISLYHWLKGARSLMRSDLLQHSRDTDTVARYLRRLGYKNIYVAGHSFGGLTLLQADTSLFKAISLWDPSSFITHPPKKWIKRDKRTGAMISPGSYELMISPRYWRGMENFPNELDLISKINVPIQICYADSPQAVLRESSKRYFEHVRAKRELVAIKGASHSFVEEGLGDVLYEKTLRWFRKF